MNIKIKPFVLAINSALLAMASGSALAQGAAAGIEEVIVTARKAEESVQVVPVSVTALSAESLAKAAVLDVQDLRSAVPGFFIATNSQGGAPTFAIRAAKADNGTSDTVTPYIDDMPVATTRGIANMVYDMQSISVLKGPQGTLFGANSTGGAVIFRPNKPINVFEGYAEVGIGNYGRESFQGMVNLPVNDVLALRVAGEAVKRDGFFRNLTPTNGHSEMGDDKHESLRFSASLKPSTATRHDLVLDYFHEDDQPYPDTPVALRGNYTFTGAAAPIDYAAAGVRVPTNPRNVSFGPEPSWNKAKYWDAIYTATHEFNDQISFKSVLGYQDANLDTFQNNNGTKYASPDGRTLFEIKQWSWEPSMDFKSADGRFRNKTGLFISDKKVNNGVSYTVQGLPYNGLAIGAPGYPATRPIQSNSWYQREFKSHAVYTQFSYDLSKEMTATLGLRYTWDRGSYNAETRLGLGVRNGVSTINLGSGTPARVGDFHSGTCAGPGTPFAPGLSTYENFNATACTGEKSLKSQAPSFTFTLEDKFAEKSMVYATLRGGYLVGGFNNQVFVPGGFAQKFEPEKVVDLETGLKSDWDLWNRPIRTNLAVFYGNYKNQQRVQNGVTASGVSFIAVANAGASTFYGLDLDVTYEATDKLELTAAWNHLETEYTKFNAPINIPGATPFEDYSGRAMAQAPKDVVNLSATATWPLASEVGTVKSTLSWFWTDKTTHHDGPAYGCTPNASGQCFGPSSPAVDFRFGDTLPAYDLWNFTTSWKAIMGSRFDANFWVKNLTDKNYATYGSNQMNQYGYVTYTYGHPREIGLNLRYNF